MYLRRAALALLLILPMTQAFGQEAAPNPDRIKFAAYVLADAFYSFNITNYMNNQQGSGNPGYFVATDDSVALGIAELGVTARQGLAAAHISLIYGSAPYLLSLSGENLWEGYVSYKPADWELRLGRLAPFIGFEKLETTENWNMSRSLAFTYLFPRQNMGFSAQVNPSESFSATGFILTPVDFAPPHHGKTFGVKFTGKPQPDLTLTVAGMTGPYYVLGNTDTFANYIGELSVLWKVEEKFSLALASYYYSLDTFGTNRFNVLDVALYGRYEFQEDWSVAFRFEEFLDLQAGSILYFPGFGTPAPLNTKEGREATLTLERKLTANLRTRLEGRMDWALGDGADYTVGPFAGGESMQFTATLGAALGF